MNDYVNLGILNWNMLNRKVVCLGTGTHHILTEWHFWPPSFVRGWRTEGTFGTTKKSDFWPPWSVGNEMAFLFTLNKGYTHNFDPIDSCSNYISVEISLQVFTNRAFKILNIFFTCSKSSRDRHEVWYTRVFLVFCFIEIHPKLLNPKRVLFFFSDIVIP